MSNIAKCNQALLAGTALVVLVCSSLFAQETSDWEWGDRTLQHTALSATELLADGQEFDGWKIEVRGWFSIDTEHIALFASREAYDYFDGTSSFFIGSFSSDVFTEELLRTLDGKRVLIQGVYRDSRRDQVTEADGPLGVLILGLNSAGSIEDINFIRRLSE